MRAWRLSNSLTLPLDRPRLMGILNVTPDSFADGGRHVTVDAAVAHALRMVGEGADLIDVGGESTRPGAARVGAAEQVRRVVPVIRALRAALALRGGRPVGVTIDTTLAEVAAAALDAGADAINDVAAGTEDGAMLALAAARGCGVVLMHRLRPPGADTYADRYESPPAYAAGVVGEVDRFLHERAASAIRAGVRAESIVIDPGLGFGKSVEQNLALIDATGRLAASGFPVLSGLSRKSFVGRVALGRDSTPDERLAGTLTMSVRHARAGAAIFRVHDVGAHARALGLSDDATTTDGAA